MPLTWVLEKRLNTFTPFSETSPERLSLTIEETGLHERAICDTQQHEVKS